MVIFTFYRGKKCNNYSTENIITILEAVGRSLLHAIMKTADCFVFTVISLLCVSKPSNGCESILLNHLMKLWAPDCYDLMCQVTVAVAKIQ